MTRGIDTTKNISASKIARLGVIIDKTVIIIYNNIVISIYEIWLYKKHKEVYA